MCVALMVNAQDIIITKSEKAINAIVKEVGKAEIKYVAADNVNGPLFVIGTDEVTSILYSNGTTQVFEDTQKPQEVKVKHETTGYATTSKVKPDPFIMDFHIQYSGRNSRSVSKSKSDMGDITSGFTVGMGFYNALSQHFVINYGVDFDFNFNSGDGYKSHTCSMLIPLRFGLQHTMAITPKKKQYIRLLTGPMFDIGLAGETKITYDKKTTTQKIFNSDNRFNCVWDIRAEYQYSGFALYLGTAWGMYSKSKDPKNFSNMPIYVGVAIKF